VTDAVDAEALDEAKVCGATAVETNRTHNKRVPYTAGRRQNEEWNILLLLLR